MLIRGATEEQIMQSAETARVDPYNLRRPSRGTGYRLQLHTLRESLPDGPRGGKRSRVVWGRRGFRRNENGERSRVIGAVCWHGHRAFFRALFKLAPDAVVITALARYDGREGFERNFPATYYRESGGRRDPAFYGNLCDCPEGDERVSGAWPGDDSLGEPVSAEGYLRW